MNSKRAKEKTITNEGILRACAILPCEFKLCEDESEDCCEKVRTEDEGAIPTAAEFSSPVVFGVVLLMFSRIFFDY